MFFYKGFPAIALSKVFSCLTGCCGESFTLTGCCGEVFTLTGCCGEAFTLTGCCGEVFTPTGCCGETFTLTGCRGEVFTLTGCCEEAFGLVAQHGYAGRRVTQEKASEKMEDRMSKIEELQERIGYRGKPFTLYKFRSMTTTAEADGQPRLCAKNDIRLTKVGRYLRNHHLDELPQLWNVLKGEMSFIGPRPERQFFVKRIMSINPDYALLYKLRPGLFSWATLYNGYTDTMEKMLERLRMDLDYLANRSFAMDMKIIYLTMISILSGKKF